MSARCSVCTRDPREYAAEHDGPEVICQGCVAGIADRLEGRPRIRCVCGGVFRNKDRNRHSYALTCDRCGAPPTDEDFMFFFDVLLRFSWAA